MMDSTDMHHIQLTLSKDEWDRMDTALSDTPYLLHNMHQVCDLLSSGIIGGFIKSDDPGISGVLELCGRALKAAALQEGEALQILERKVRTAVSESANRRREKEFAAQDIAGQKP